jgi:hypothetical protein
MWTGDDVIDNRMVVVLKLENGDIVEFEIRLP